MMENVEIIWFSVLFLISYVTNAELHEFEVHVQQSYC